jgi:RNA polymerase sigma-70 factor (ECF subfamily)
VASDAIDGTQVRGDPMPPDELALVRAAQRDPVAFDPLYERYIDRVYAYLRARATTPEDAADLTQQVFTHALAALPRYRAGSFAAWLFRIARNTAVDAHRRRRATISWDLVPEALHPVTEDDAEARLLAREARDRARHLVADLPPDKRELLALRYAARLSTAEIAAVIGKSEAATRQQLSRVLRALQEHYHDSDR